jgi:biopolymer transport protein ExbB
VTRQLNDLANPSAKCAGRVVLAFRGGDKAVNNPELTELRLSEAVLKEIPKIERFQSFCGLPWRPGPCWSDGTVIGMIITFHAIVASGSSDPRLMAHGIGQAMIATVLGLGIAIPLLFINSGLAALSGAITQILDEQSEVMLAADILERRHAA